MDDLFTDSDDNTNIPHSDPIADVQDVSDASLFSQDDDPDKPTLVKPMLVDGKKKFKVNLGAKHIEDVSIHMELDDNSASQTTVQKKHLKKKADIEMIPAGPFAHGPFNAKVPIQQFW